MWACMHVCIPVYVCRHTLSMHGDQQAGTIRCPRHHIQVQILVVVVVVVIVARVVPVVAVVVVVVVAAKPVAVAV